MLTQLYRQEIVEDLDLPDKEWKRRQLAKDLGFNRQAPKLVAEAARLYPELKGSDLKVWRRFLPGNYSRQQGWWKRYNFDTIPPEVLEEIQAAVTFELFDDIAIWTPENESDTDPMAVGLVYADEGTHYFPIARWGESLYSTETVRHLLNARGACARKRAGHWSLGVLTVALAILAALLLLLPYHNNPVAGRGINVLWVAFVAIWINWSGRQRARRAASQRFQIEQFATSA